MSARLSVLFFAAMTLAVFGTSSCKIEDFGCVSDSECRTGRVCDLGRCIDRSAAGGTANNGSGNNAPNNGSGNNAPNNGGDNNGAENNGAENNGTGNNGAENNGTENNGTPNNGDNNVAQPCDDTNQCPDEQVCDPTFGRCTDRCEVADDCERADDVCSRDLDDDRTHCRPADDCDVQIEARPPSGCQGRISCEEDGQFILDCVRVRGTTECSCGPDRPGGFEVDGNVCNDSATMVDLMNTHCGSRVDPDDL